MVSHNLIPNLTFKDLNINVCFLWQTLFFYKPSRSEANLWLRVLFQVFYALTCSWVRLLVALRPSSWMWFCSSWIIWGKPVDTARSKTYIFAMSERKKNSSIFQTTLCNAHFKMQRWKKCVDKDTPHLNTKAPSVPSHVAPSVLLMLCSDDEWTFKKTHILPLVQVLCALCAIGNFSRS